MNLSLTLTKNEKVKHYIRIKTHKPIALKFWVESDVSVVKNLSCVLTFKTIPFVALLAFGLLSKSSCPLGEHILIG